MPSRVQCLELFGLHFWMTQTETLGPVLAWDLQVGARGRDLERGGSLAGDDQRQVRKAFDLDRMAIPVQPQYVFFQLNLLFRCQVLLADGLLCSRWSPVVSVPVRGGRGFIRGGIDVKVCGAMLVAVSLAGVLGTLHDVSGPRRIAASVRESSPA